MTFKKITAVFLLIWITLFGSIVYFLFQNIDQSSIRKEWEVHSQNIIEQVNIVLMNNYQQETNARGYAITGDLVFFNAYITNIPSYNNNLNYLRELLKDDLIQTYLLDKIEQLRIQKSALLLNTIKLRLSDFDMAVFREIIIIGGDLNEKINAVGAQMLSNETTHLMQRKESFNENIQQSKSTLYLISVLLLLTLFIFIRHSLRTFQSIQTSNAQLLQFKNRFYESLKYAKVAAFDWHDTSTDSFWVSRTISEMLGDIDVEEFGEFGTFYNTYMHPSDRAHVKEALAEHLKSGKNYLVNYRLKHANGKYIHFKSTGSSFQEGGKIRMIGVIINIEDELKLNESREQLIAQWEEFSKRFELTLESSNYGVWDWADINESEQWWSDTLFKLIGYKPDEIEASNENFINLIHPDDQERVRIAQQMNLSEGEKFALDYKIKTKSMGYHWFRASGNHIIDTHTGKTRMIGVISDISQERLFLEELERSNQELENFAYIASHDLQEPLRKIQAFGDLLKIKFEQNDEELPGQEYVEKMNTSAERLRLLIQDLLNYSRVSSENEYKDDISLQEVLSEVIDLLQENIEKNNVVFTIQKDLPSLSNCNRSNMIQLFQNIISNAIKFRKDGIPPEITITSELISLQEASYYNVNLNLYEKYVKICINDNGIGFKEEYLSKIFTIFQRLHGKSEYEGTGLGLAICKKICENHDGYITANSVQNEGTRFIIILPHN